MARIYQAGTLNTTALSVPNMYVQIVPPQTLINGVSSGRLGVVGTASWGPVGSAMTVGGMGDYLTAFGMKQALATDMGVAVNVAILQGASDFRCVRVTDGTDVAAAGSLSGTQVTARYTGTTGNAITVTMTDTGGGNFTLSTSHATLGTLLYKGKSWESISALVSADASAVIVLGNATGAPTAGTVTLSGGTDGGVPTTAQFIGTDTTTRTGMYALRNTGCALGVIAGLSDSLSYSTQAAYGMGEGTYMVTSGHSGDTIGSAQAAFANSGGASYALKVMFGDWIWWDDDTNGLMLVPPSLFAAGKLAALSPEQSSLNKQLYGIAGSQKAGLTSSGHSMTYSDAELTALFGSGIDVIATPSPGGEYWSVRNGHNSSGSASVHGDNYTRLTNYLAETIATGMGVYIGEPINDDLFGNIRATLLGFLEQMLAADMLGLYGGALPYTVVCDTSNNPQSRTALGFVQADVAVRYMGIVEKFIVNLQGGSTVTISTSAGA